MSSITIDSSTRLTVEAVNPAPYKVDYVNGIIENIGLRLTKLPGGNRGDGIMAEQFIKEGSTLIETRLDHTVLTASTPQSLAEKLLDCETYDYFEKLLELDDSDLPGCFGVENTNNNRFEESLFMLLAERRGREADALVEKTGHPLRKCKAALHCVHSRCLFLQELSLFVLPPFVEYLNHDKDPNAHWILVDGKTLVVKSRRDINPNEEVTITYGNHCNEVFAIQYFFVPKNNPNDVLYMQLRREMTCMRLANYDGMSVNETKSNFIPFGFVEYGNGNAMKIAKVVHPEDPTKFLHWKLTKMRQELEKNMITLMKKKRMMKKTNGKFSSRSQLWLEYLQLKVQLISTHIQAIQAI